MKLNIQLFDHNLVKTPLQFTLQLPKGVSFQNLHRLILKKLGQFILQSKLLEVAAFVTRQRDFLLDHQLGRWKTVVEQLPPQLSLQTYYFQMDSMVFPGDRVRPQHFQNFGLIGKGNYADVFLVRFRANAQLMVLKRMSKSHFRGQYKELPNRQLQALRICKSRFIVEPYFAFQTEQYICFVLELVASGDLFTINQCCQLPTFLIAAYSFEILKALETIHKAGLVYRDLKPENVVIDLEGHIKLIDFGFAVRMDLNVKQMCGSPPFIAPEVLNKEGATACSDYYSLGMLLYEISARRFFKPDEKELKLLFGEDFNPDLKDLILKLTAKEPFLRLGANGIKQIFAHPFVLSAQESVATALRDRMKLARLKNAKLQLTATPLELGDWRAECQFCQEFNYKGQQRFQHLGPKMG